ncbi:GspE/PulE family protein [Stieleria sp. JC731]|uniref:GspE/PulE family protein n=1 Tax=Pirellulaceae TaxID=2691357 RepID=UPI001E5E28DC|nr:GspE/PulE family protein [Stieleria sp. JC731]MCC9604000.1 GspE/PulE family protein [Stieleria sp. JC731]
MKAVNSSSTATASSQRHPLIIQLLDRLDRLDPERLEDLWQSVGKDNCTVEESIIRCGLASETQIASCYSEHYLVPLFDPPINAAPPIDPSIASILPYRLCRDHLVAPLNDDGSILEVAVFAPDSLLLADEVRLLTGRQMRPMFAPLTVVERLLNVLYQGAEWTDPIPAMSDMDFEEIDDDECDEEDDVAVAESEVLHLDQSPPPGRDGRIIGYVNGLFEQALSLAATDIHLECYETSCRVRLRIDGVLTEISPPPVALVQNVTNRLKILAQMNVEERKLPQDGVITVRFGDDRVNLRMSTCPTINGENVAMKVLDKAAVPLDLSKLGLTRRQRKDLMESIRCQSGLMLVTGPTTCGKTTTVYSCLESLNDAETNLCTVEDPVEFRIDGINQMQTHSQDGFGYVEAAKALLRQDPDVLMVGELPDHQTADVCMRASMAGRVVLSTMHTEDAIGAIVRLQDMGIEAYRLADALRVIVAQRLIRRLCDECKVPYHLDQEISQRYGIPGDLQVFRAVGCDKCRKTGYRGRVAVFEVIRINDQLRQMILAGESSGAMKEFAVKKGMKLLAQSAMDKVVDGLTSFDEAVCLYNERR